MLSLWTNPFLPEKSKSDSRMSTKNYFDRLFEDTFETMTKDLFGSRYIGSNYSKNEDGSLSISIDVPGIKESDISIEADGNIISVKGETKSDRSYRSVQQSFTVPEGYSSDDVQAALADGVLTLTLAAKQLPEKEVKKIPIKTGQ